MTATRAAAIAGVAALVAAIPVAWAAPQAAPSADAKAPQGDAIRPAAERAIIAEPGKKPAALGRGAVREGGSSGQPAIMGPKIPEALRHQLQQKLDAQQKEDLLILRIHARSEAELEQWTVRRKKDLFERTFGVEIEIEEIPEGSSDFDVVPLSGLG